MSRMAQQTQQVPRQEQPGSSGESAPAGGDQEVPIREQFRRRLEAERESKEPVGRQEQPDDEIPDTERASETQDEDEYDADEEGTPSEEESEDTDEDPDTEEEPDAEDDEPSTLTVDDRQYSAEDIRALENRVREYDADYRRKTQVMSRIRQEYQARGEEVQQVSGFFKSLAKANVQQLEQIDPSKLNQEQFAAWKQQLDAAKAGEQQLMGYIDKITQTTRENREKMLDHQAQESAEILRSIDRRWSNEFYGQLRDFAVETGRFTKEEFADLTDWRTFEGLIALFDMQQAQKNVKEKRETKEPPTKRRKRNRKQARNQRGQFQNAEQAVRQSTNAKQDGSLRSYFQQKLAAERQGR